MEYIAAMQRKLQVPLGLVPSFAWNGEITPYTSIRKVKGIRHMAESLGVRLPVLSAFIFWPPNPCLTDKDAKARDAAVSLLQKQVELAWELGTLITPVAIANRKEPATAPERLEELAVDSLSRIQVPDGIILAVEHLLDGFTTSPKRFCRVLSKVGNSHLSWDFDPANVIAGKALSKEALHLEPGETVNQATSPAYWLATIGRPAMVDIKGVNLNNQDPWMPQEARATSARYWPLCLQVADLSGGSIDWSEILQLLDEYNYTGWLVYEGLKSGEAAINDMLRLIGYGST